MTNETVTQVVMEGDLVRIIEVKTVKQANMADFLPLLQTRQPIHIPALPKNLSHLGANPMPNGDTEVDLVIEFLPQPRQITWHARDNDPTSTFRLAMPWTYFVFNMHTSDAALRTAWTCQNWKVFWTKKKVTSLTDNMMRVFLPNVYEDGRICFGNLGRAGNTSLAEFVDATVNTFWISTFNNHLTVPLPGDYKNFDEWAADTAVTEACWEKWKMLDNKKVGTLQEILRGGRDRFAPVIVEGTIPNVPMPLTFDAIDQWFALMDDNGKARMRDYVSGAGQYTLRPRM